MSILPQAENFVVQKSQIGSDNTIQIQNNISMNSSGNGIDFLLQATIPGAAHDSVMRHPPPRCFPGTREQYIEDITQWAASSLDHDGSQPIEFKKLKLLGATFFFSISRQGDHEHFFTSIAYQLCQCPELSDFRQILDERVSRDKSIVGKAMAWQFECLISEPIQELRKMGKDLPKKVIIIDGLDECGDKDAQCEIIEIIAESVRKPSNPFYWAFLSRPETQIETTFTKDDILPHCHLTVLPISREIDHEIEIYLRSGLTNILRCRNLSVTSPWPSERDMKALVEACAGLFVYAATLLRYVNRPVPQGPIDQLNAVLVSLVGASTRPGAGSPFAELDAFYTLILKRIPQEILPSVLILLGGMFLYSFHSTLFWGALQLSNQQRLSEVQFKTICSELRAVFQFYDHDGPYEAGVPSVTTMSSIKGLKLADFGRIQQRARTLGGVITLHHKSFWDYLHDPERSGPYCISTPEMYDHLFSHYITVWGDCQRCFDIPGLPSEPIILKAEPPVPLAWPHINAFVSAYNYARLFNTAGVLIGTLCFRYVPDRGLLRALAKLDHRKHILCQILALPDGLPIVVHGLTYDCDIIVRRVGNTLIRSVQPSSFYKFSVANFIRMTELWKKSGVTKEYHQRYFPDSNHCSGGKARRVQINLDLRYVEWGRGDKRVFWCWTLNIEHQYLREFWTTDLREGSRLFAEQDFDSWEDSAHRAKGFQGRN
ncbi:hypothetical protein NP233_g11391 [Leucocoprinus birnbaumii]|uniref:Nephrocystin 3-like N-terminal domain-containing protein n=1 Tax=Leucocoprinus birnbaumii TaxID=56174 RepID=A0AAD5VGM7_9AGAR|nr:hypothetical protein NP233_g11391 [Leucocoprinus birnbaumii]